MSAGQLELVCGRCGARASWILPRRWMLPHVRAVAAHVGWSDMGDHDQCPSCARPPVSRRKPWTVTVWDERLISRLCNFRQSGLLWSEVADALSAELDRPFNAYQCRAAWWRHWQAELKRDERDAA